MLTASPVANVESRVVGDDLAGLDADAGLELELAHGVEDAEGGAHGTLGVVLVGHRDAERGHDGVAGELLDDAAVLRHALRDVLEVLRDAAAHDLGVGARHQRRRPDQVDEHHRGELAFHAHKCRNDSAGL